MFDDDPRWGSDLRERDTSVLQSFFAIQLETSALRAVD